MVEALDEAVRQCALLIQYGPWLPTNCAILASPNHWSHSMDGFFEEVSEKSNGGRRYQIDAFF